ncbi:MAG: hypothetical protein AAB036_03430 [Elusimicrobiota bacterium]
MNKLVAGLTVLIPALGFAQSVRVAPLTIPGMTPQVQAAVYAPAASLRSLSVLPVLPALSAALPAPAPVAAKTALSGLQVGAAALAATPETKVSPEAASQAMFDGSAQPSAVVAQVDAPVDGLNATIAEVLKPFNNQVSKASFVFNKLSMNPERVTHVDAALGFEKQGPDGKASLKIAPLTYSHPEDGSLPKTQSNANLNFDLHLVMTQEQINMMGPEADTMVADFINSTLKQYGDAAVADARITNRKTDEKGNLTGLGMVLGIKIDLSKLPAGMDPKDVELVEAKVGLDVSLTGVALDLSVVHNPKSKYFERNQEGLKENIDKLIAKDKKALGEIKSAVKFLGMMADYLTTRSTGSNVGFAPKTWSLKKLFLLMTGLTNTLHPTLR